jgi:L-fuculose-phosphate aldolase
MEGSRQTARRRLTPELRPHAEVALLARMLYRAGYDDGTAGHISYRQDDGSLLVNPYELCWDELCPSDVMRIDLDGNVLDGRWSVPPAIMLHLEIHRQRPQVRVAVHNHSRWGTIWADLHRIPPVYDQTSALLAREIALFDEYDGAVVDRENARKAAAAMGRHPATLLANHGVLVVADSVRQAYRRGIVLEWRCRQAWHVETIGGGVELRADVADKLAAMVSESDPSFVYEAMVRRELRADPGMLER